MSYQELLNMKYKSYLYWHVGFIILILILIFLQNYEVYDIYNTYGYYDKGGIKFNIPFINSDIINNMEYLKINNENYEYQNISISEILLDQATLTNYQEVSIEGAKSFIDNQVLKVTIYHNKEKIIKKIQKLLF